MVAEFVTTSPVHECLRVHKRNILISKIANHVLQVAHEFADLHDRAGRMKAKGVVRDVVEWGKSREYFFWRTKRRLAENEVSAVLCCYLVLAHISKPTTHLLHFDNIQAFPSIFSTWLSQHAILQKY